MKKIKNLVMISIILTLLITLAGCTKQDNSTSNSNNKNSTNASSSNSKTSSNSTSNSTSSNNASSAKEKLEKYDFVSAAKKQVAAPEAGETIAVLHVKNYGDIKVKFFKEVAPKAVENFISLSKKGYYNGVTFHRVINNFMIQGGDPTATGRGGQSTWGKSFEDEFDYSVAPYRGALCMANSGSNTNGSQFFIEQANYEEGTCKYLESNGYPKNLLEAYKLYGGSMHLFCRHTVFGQVIEGMDIVDKIAACNTDSNNKPVEDVVIESIEITNFK